MTKLMSRLLLALFLCVSIHAQVIPNPFIFVAADPAGACSNFGPSQFNYVDGIMWNCVNAVWTPYTGMAGAGTVTSVGLAGTANQITVTGATPITGSGSWTLSIPSALVIPGTINKITLTTPATGATLTIPDGVTLTGPSASATVATLGLTNTFTGRQDAGGAASTTPWKIGTVAGIPATCTVGDGYFGTTATAGANLFFCTTTNTWTQVSGGGGAGTVSVVSSGSLCSTCIVSGGGTTLVQTPNTSTTLSSGGDISTPGSVSSGVGSSAGGNVQMHSGTAATANSSSFGWSAGTAMTASVVLVSPDAVPTADSFMLWQAAPTSNLDIWTYTQFVNCGDSTHALSYSTSTHLFGCQAISTSASAGGSNTQVQYNNSGALGGITNFTSNGTNVLLTAITAPSTPSAGFGIPYVDSTSKNIALKNDAGTVNHGVQTTTCTNQAVRVIADDGSVTCVTITSAYADSSIAKTVAASTYTSGTQDFSVVSLKVPNSAALAPTTSALVGYDTTNNNWRLGANGTSLWLGGFAALPTNGNCVSVSVVSSVLRLTDGGACGSAPLSSVGATFTNGTSALATGVYCCVVAPHGGTIQSWNITVDDNTGAGTCTSCTATVKFWRVASGTATPTSSNSINTSGVALATGTAVHSSTLTDFTNTTVTANDIFAIQLSAVANAHAVTASITYQ